jgi:hypothetical protein
LTYDLLQAEKYDELLTKNYQLCPHITFTWSSLQ